MADYQITVNDESVIELSADQLTNMDIVPKGNGQFHFLHKDRSYRLEVLQFNPVEKTLLLKVNGIKHQVSMADRYDQLISKMGLESVKHHKINEVVAPMPGLVIDLMVKEGQKIEEGDSLLILEAMKMENIIKAPGEGVIKHIKARKGMPVEKGAVLIELE